MQLWKGGQKDTVLMKEGVWRRRTRVKEYWWPLGAGKGKKIDSPPKLPGRNTVLVFSPKKSMLDFSPMELDVLSDNRFVLSH